MTRYLLTIDIIVKRYKHDKVKIDKATLDLDESHLPEAIQKYLDFKNKYKWEDIKFELKEL